MRQEKPEKIYHAQQGFVLIIVVSILTVIIALIAIGFSKLSSRELNQAANRESAAQAYYAAQSGINDAIAYIKDGGPDFSGCSWPTPFGDSYFTKDLSSGSNIAQYSCIGIESVPQYLSNTVTPGKPWIVKIDADHLENLYIGWENYPDLGSPAFFNDPGHPLSFGELPDYASLQPDQTGVLRTQIYSVPRSDTSDTNSNLAAGSRVYYLYPDKGNGHIKCKHNGQVSDPKKGCVRYDDGSYSATGSPNGLNGIFLSAECKNSNPKPDPSGNNLGENTYCNAEIIALDGSKPSGNFYYLYFTAQYAPLRVVIQGNDSSGNAVTFSGAQAVIDVTGKSADQIQRVRATVNLSTQFNEPNYAVQSMQSLCKAFVTPVGPSSGQYQVGPGGGSGLDSSGCVTPSAGGSIQGGGTPGH